LEEEWGGNFGVHSNKQHQQTRKTHKAIELDIVGFSLLFNDGSLQITGLSSLVEEKSVPICAGISNEGFKNKAPRKSIN